jgi:hypothetical protein
MEKVAVGSDPLSRIWPSGSWPAGQFMLPEELRENWQPATSEFNKNHAQFETYLPRLELAARARTLNQYICRASDDS